MPPSAHSPAAASPMSSRAAGSNGSAPFPSANARILLLGYFRSGWAFFIPYLAAYLLYAWLRWPVQAAGTEPMNQDAGRIPGLLHVYWFLHALHLVLAVVALVTWFRDRKLSPPEVTATTRRRPFGRIDHARLIPWFCVALFFWIPGTYLEWPADPWEHLRRINEWRGVAVVSDHSAWFKSSYFISYSLLARVGGLRQMLWLDFYHAGIGLLLCWQYYRLARTCGLTERPAMVFVVLQALLLGNNTFSFYRYYGISSSIYAQLGAVALTRIALEAANSPWWRGCFQRLAASLGQQPARKSDAATAGSSGGAATPFAWARSLAGFLLLALIAFNHVQGLGIAALGIAAVTVWRLIEWKRAALAWLVAGTLAANALFLWWYPPGAMIETYRTAGYFNAWLGFNLFDLQSPAGDRMLQIVGAFGLVNLAAALVLLRRNHVIGWLTVLPLGAMLLPVVAVPLAHVLVQHGSSAIYIVTFQRMLFSIPPGLALVCLGAQLMRKRTGEESARPNPWAGFAGFAVVCAALMALVTTPASAPAYNRAWHANAIVPDDLRLRDVFAAYESIRPRLLPSPDAKVVATQAGTAVLYAYPIQLVGPSDLRLIATPATDSALRALDFLAAGVRITARPYVPASPALPAMPHPVATPNLVADPSAANPAAWTALGGLPPQFVSGIPGLSRPATALQNPPGETSNVFTSQVIPIKPLSSYRVEMTVRQTGNTEAILYLAIAWCDLAGNLLHSDVAPPQGAGHPRGWSNGTFSYFGLVSQVAPTAWATHRIAFGLNEIAAIPPNARFMRVGALLNSNATPAATILLTGIGLFEKAPPAVGLMMPQATSAYSSASQAAQLSRHWPPHQVPADRVGTKEIEAASGPALDHALAPSP